MNKLPHEILEISATSTNEEATKAWKNKLKTCHPDVHQTEEAKKKAEEETKILNKAYDDFVNPRPSNQNPFPNHNFNPSDIFSQMFAGRFNFGGQQGAFTSIKQIHQEANISLVDFLKQKEIELDVVALNKKIKLKIPENFKSGDTLTIKISENKNQILILNLKLHLTISEMNDEKKKKIIEILSAGINS